MSSIQIQNLPDDLYNQIQRLASHKNMPLDATVIYLLQQSIASTTQVPSQKEVLARIRSRSRVNPTALGLPDSTEMIRSDRNR
jgi:plasmid stability protein